MLRVAIIAPSPALRAGLRALLASGPLEVVGEAASLADLGATLPCDVIVVAGSSLPRTAPGPALVLLSDDAAAVEALRALPLPGWALLPSDTSAAELLAAVQAAGTGLAVLPLAVANRLGPPRPPPDPASETLTAREREVLTMLSQGLSNKLIARQLQISEHTVKFHVAAIFAKLGAASRTEAVSLGARSGLITL